MSWRIVDGRRRLSVVRMRWRNHISCMVGRARADVANGSNDNWRDANDLTDAWTTCKNCGNLHPWGPISVALSWEWWKWALATQAEASLFRGMALNGLPNVYFENDEFDKAIQLFDATLSWQRRSDPSGKMELITLGRLSEAYLEVGRVDEGLRMIREYFPKRLTLLCQTGMSSETLTYFSDHMLELRLFDEAIVLLREQQPMARQRLGRDNALTLALAVNLSFALVMRECNIPLEDVVEAEALSKDALKRIRRLGDASDIFPHYIHKAEHNLRLCSELFKVSR
mmetsp:Transcript_12982/g.40026  ORF Transcript_12982/g.40026 Transcript_12982/m.40026 type:complete len:284 (-) Transcript_12982:46-897(-)